MYNKFIYRRLHWIFLLDTTDKIFKRTPTESSTPHEANKMSIQKGSMLTHLSFLVSLHAHPHIFDVLRVHQSIGIDEIKRMINRLMDVLVRTDCDVVVCSPLIALDCSTRTNILVDDRLKRCSIASFD